MSRINQKVYLGFTQGESLSKEGRIRLRLIDVILYLDDNEIGCRLHSKKENMAIFRTCDVVTPREIKRISEIPGFEIMLIKNGHLHFMVDLRN